MSLNNKPKWKPCEHEWLPFEDTDTYKKYLQNKQTFNKNKEVISMNTELHSEVNKSYGRVKRVIDYFTMRTLGKFFKNKERTDKWKVEFWLNDNNSHDDFKYTCGVALKRPKKETIYVQKIGKSINECVRRSLHVLKKQLQSEKKSWSSWSDMQQRLS